MIKVIRELIEYRDLIWSLTVRDLKIKYKGAALGFLWSILHPIMTMIIMTVVFSMIVKIDVDKYPLFVLCGLLAWNFTSISLTQATTSIINNSLLIKKVYLPREIFPISIVVSNFIHFLIGLCVYFVLMFIFGIKFSYKFFLIFLVIPVQFIFVTGICLLFSCLDVFFRDITHILSVLIMLWFYLTPVFYPIEMVPAKYLSFYIINPMAVFIHNYREILLQNKLMNFDYYLLATLISIIFFIISYYIFIRLERLFGEVI